MSYPKIIEENLYALNKEKKFESHIPKINFLSENRKWKKKKNDIIFHKNKNSKKFCICNIKQSRRCWSPEPHVQSEQVNTPSVLKPVATHADFF